VRLRACRPNAAFPNTHGFGYQATLSRILRCRMKRAGLRERPAWRGVGVKPLAKESPGVSHPQLVTGRSPPRRLCGRSDTAGDALQNPPQNFCFAFPTPGARTSWSSVIAPRSCSLGIETRRHPDEFSAWPSGHERRLSKRSSKPRQARTSPCRNRRDKEGNRQPVCAGCHALVLQSMLSGTKAWHLALESCTDQGLGPTETVSLPVMPLTLSVTVRV
jgi:hypothetical protein